MALLGAEMGVRVVTCSQVYETPPWPELGSPRETWHLNCAVEIETDLPPRRLLRLTQAIESRSGRVLPAGGLGPSGPRPLDIDILLYADQVIAEDRLQTRTPSCTSAGSCSFPSLTSHRRSSTRRSTSRSRTCSASCRARVTSSRTSSEPPPLAGGGAFC